MAENTELQAEETEIEETEVEAHAMLVLPLQGLGTPEPEGILDTNHSATSIIC